MLLKNQSFCGPALSTDAGNGLVKLAGQVLQSQGSRYGLDSPFIGFFGKDTGPIQIARCSPLKAAGRLDLLSPQAASLEESPTLEQTRWVSYSQPTGGSQSNTEDP